MKRKRTPPTEHLVRLIDQASDQTELVERLNQLRYAGDVKWFAERYGLHYLRSKRLRVRELRQWILDHHPLVRKESSDVG